jgi:hypothetical protein
MSDQTHYEKQPDVLPLTLPAGTRTRMGLIACGAGWRFNDALGVYAGEVADYPGGPVRNSYVVCRPEQVNWETVPVPLPAPAADRPIQAGDWVECIEHWSRSSPPQGIGDRFEVVGMVGSSLCFAEYPCAAWLVERFKRVDGPHCDRIATQCSDAQCGGCDSCINRQRDYYAELTTKRDPYTEHRLAVEPDSACMRDPKPEALAARARLAAWERAEKPRVANRAEARELAKLHPWEEFE